MEAEPTDAVGGAGERFGRAIAAIDAANAQDPVRVDTPDGPRPKELVHAERMTHWVRHLAPDADDAQLLAARAHHLRRWALPRTEYPQGRAGYLRWRAEQKLRHAAEVGAILEAVGYDDAVAARVRQLVTKQGLGRDPGVQVHEDALCLVFLEQQLDDVAERLGDDHAVEVLRRTAAKMSERAVAVAADLDLSPHGRALLDRALGDGAPPD